MDVESSEGTLILPKASYVLDLPPSCIEFCPAHPEYFVVGTYNLEKTVQPETEQSCNEDDQVASEAQAPQNRNGSLITFRLQHDQA